MEFKDIKYNRKSELQYRDASRIISDRIEWMTIHPSINLYDNITVHSFDIKIHTGDAVR
jgi:hypothetical protein